jgi:hypothetical protein
MEHSSPEFLILEQFSKLFLQAAELRLENDRLKEDYDNELGDRSFDTNKSMNEMAPQMFMVLNDVLAKLVTLSETRVKEHGSAFYGYAWYPESFDSCIKDIQEVINKVKGIK